MNNKEQLNQQRLHLLEMIAQLSLNSFEMATQLEKINSRRDAAVEDLVSVVNQINYLEEKEKESNVLEVVK